MNKLSNKLIRKAGANLSLDQESGEDLNIISAFRTSHIYLMDTLIKTIKNKLPKPILIARRLKRLSSIKNKLKRFNTMQLDRMQDIAGVRALFKSDQDVFEYANNLREIYSKPNTTFELIKESDYISTSKLDGYRSYHMIFKYIGTKEELKNRNIELQLRTLLHHYWATAVEIWDIQSRSSIKSGKGDEIDKRFFYLCSNLLNGDNTVIGEIIAIDKEYNILKKLNSLRVVTNNLTTNKDGYYLASLDYNSNVLTLIYFNNDDKSILAANTTYKLLETEPNIDSVLVKINDANRLKKAYPNYFLDAKNFIKEIKSRLNQQN